MPDRIAPGFFCSRAIMRIDVAILQTPRQFWMTNTPKHIPTWREFALPDEEELFGLLMDKLKEDINENVRIRNTEAIKSLPGPLAREELGQYPINKQYWLRRGRAEAQAALYTAYEALYTWAEQISSDSPQDWGLFHHMLKQLESIDEQNPKAGSPPIKKE